MTDKPLHVRVAEALGWPPCEYITDEAHDPKRPIYGWRVCHREHAGGQDCEHMWHCGKEDYYAAPSYDTAWSETGPLIERYAITLHGADLPDETPWIASRVLGAADVYEGEGATPLFAVCRLILALSEAGKLDALLAAPATR